MERFSPEHPIEGKPYRIRQEQMEAIQNSLEGQDHAEGKVTKVPFRREKIVARREKEQKKWFSKMQNHIKNLIGYINDPEIKVETNFSSLDKRSYMESFMRFADEFSTMENVIADDVEALAQKHGLNDLAIYGPEGILNLARASQKMMQNHSDEKIVRLTLEGAGENYTRLEYKGVGKLRNPYVEMGRPIPDSISSTNPVVGMFENLEIAGKPIKVKFTSEITGSKRIKGIIENYSRGGGHNDFEVEFKDGEFVGNTRWKEVKGRTAAEFIRNVLKTNREMNAKTEKNYELAQKGENIDYSGERSQTPEALRATVDYMKNSYLKKIIEGQATESDIKHCLDVRILSPEQIASAYKLAVKAGKSEKVKPVKTVLTKFYGPIVVKSLLG